MDSNSLEYRMYGLVPYNISPIQKAIQYGHAVVEYSLKFGSNERDNINESCKRYFKWAREYKTFIILNGGTTSDKKLKIPIGNSILNTKTGYVGTLNNHRQYLADIGVDFASFREPDLGDQLTAVVFLADERVFDNKKYPFFKDVMDATHNIPRGRPETDIIISYPDEFRKYKESIGGEENYRLKYWLKQFKLA